MLYPEIAKELIQLSQHDFEVRQLLVEEKKLSDGYNPQMEQVHLNNAQRLQEIISEIGWPSKDRVGDEASQAAWLIVQHTISWPFFMKNCLALIEGQLDRKVIDPIHIAFLSDRIAMYENRPQSYGTQFVGNRQGQLIPYQLDAPVSQINQRRKELGLNSVEERLTELTNQSSFEPQVNPSKEEEMVAQATYDRWRRQVGWIK